LVRELYAPTSPLKAIVSFVPNEQRGELLNNLLGLTPDDDQENIQELQSLLNWGGVPLGNVRTSQQVRELESRAFKIGELIDAKRKAQKKEILDKRKKIQNTPASDIPFDPDEAAQYHLDSLGTTP
jgi:hypothetical protein